MKNGHQIGEQQSLFEGFRTPIALISTDGGSARISAAAPGFRKLLGIGRDDAGKLLIPLLPQDWRPSVDAAIRACLGARQSKRVRGLSSLGRRQDFFDLNIYRAGEALPGHMVLSLEDLQYAKWSADPRVASLFPQLQTSNAAVVYENDLKSLRIRYRDNGFVKRFGLSGGSILLNEFEERIHPRDLKHFQEYQAARADISDEEVITLTVRLQALTGEWRPVNLRARVLRRDPYGLPRRMLGVAVDVASYNAMNAALEEAHVALAAAEEEQRRIIGRELHDSTSSHLVAASLGLQSLEKDSSSAGTLATISDIRESLTAASQEIRMFAFLLHPPELESLGLVGALEHFCAGFDRRAKVKVQLTIGGEAPPVSKEVETALYRVAQESVMNAFRHADADTIRVGLTWLSDAIVLQIEDDGKGLKGGGMGSPDHGVGLRAMRTRMTQIGGSLEFVATKGGAMVFARAPLDGRSGSTTVPLSAH